MSNKLTLREKLEKRYREQTEREDNALRDHARAYNRYFENWLEYEITTPKGRKKILRIYDGAWYSHKLTERQYVLLKICYGLCWLLAAGLFFFSAYQKTFFNGTKAAIVLGALAAIGLVLTGYQTGVYLAAPRRMTIGQYNGCCVLYQRYARVSAIALAAVAAVSLGFAVYALINGSTGVMDFLSSLLYALSGGIVYALCRLETKREYNIETCTPQVPKGAKKIKDRDLSL